MGFITDIIRKIFTRKIHNETIKEVSNTINPEWITKPKIENQLTIFTTETKQTTTMENLLKFSPSVIQNPTNQLAEILAELLLVKTITRKSAMQLGVLNLTARISQLRIQYNIDVVCVSISTKNKFGRPITYGKWHVANVDYAFTQYVNKINK
jgi:hypothetical protein